MTGQFTQASLERLSLRFLNEICERALDCESSLTTREHGIDDCVYDDDGFINTSLNGSSEHKISTAMRNCEVELKPGENVESTMIKACS